MQGCKVAEPVGLGESVRFRSETGVGEGTGMAVQYPFWRAGGAGREQQICRGLPVKPNGRRAAPRWNVFPVNRCNVVSRVKLNADNSLNIGAAAKVLRELGLVSIDDDSSDAGIGDNLSHPFDGHGRI